MPTPSEGTAPQAQAFPSPPGGWTTRRHALAWAGLLALYFFLATYCLSRVPLIHPDEPRYATAARNMAEGGSWLIPEFNDRPRYNKPPLFYWLVAISHKVLGPSEVSARVPSIVLGLLMLMLTVYAGRRLYEPGTAYVAGLVLCTSPLFMALSRTCVIDQTLSTLVAAGLFLFLLRLAGRLTWDPLLLISALMGLAFMAKGPAAALILIVPLVFVLFFARGPFLRSPGVLWASSWLVVAAIGFGWLAVQRAMGAADAKAPPWALAGIVMTGVSILYYGLRRMFAFPGWLLGLVLAGGVSAWWYLALWGHIGSEKFFELLKFEILGRLEGKMHEEPYAFYLYIFPAVFFPWSLALAGAVGSACRKVDGALPLGAGDDEGTRRSRRWLADAFLVAWLAGVVLFFTVPKAKLATYVLPAFPAAALLTARFLRRLGKSEEPVRGGWLVLTAVLGGLLVLGFVSLPLFEGQFKKDAREVIQNLPVPLWAAGIALGLLSGVPWIVVGLTRRYRVALVVLPVFVVLLVAAALPVVFNRSAYFNTSRALATTPEVQAYVRQAEAVYALGCEEGSLVWYVGRGVHGPFKPDRDPKEPLGDALQRALDAYPSGKVLLFAHEEKLKKYFDGDRLLARYRTVIADKRVCVLVNELIAPEETAPPPHP